MHIQNPYPSQRSLSSQIQMIETVTGLSETPNQVNRQQSLGDRIAGGSGDDELEFNSSAWPTFPEIEEEPFPKPPWFPPPPPDPIRWNTLRRALFPKIDPVWKDNGELLITISHGYLADVSVSHSFWFKVTIIFSAIFPSTKRHIYEPMFPASFRGQKNLVLPRTDTPEDTKEVTQRKTHYNTEFTDKPNFNPGSYGEAHRVWQSIPEPLRSKIEAIIFEQYFMTTVMVTPPGTSKSFYSYFYQIFEPDPMSQGETLRVRKSAMEESNEEQWNSR